MSRSRRKDIVKDGSYGSKYWRTIRRVQRNDLRKVHTRNVIISESKLYHYIEDDFLYELLNINIKHNREIINDYDFCDYKFRDCGVKFSRK